ncbi:MAG: aspartate ammonia-lyase, partial [Xanthomonadales bacterium]|nr:aspartate ammonia-lyase [Xanthomonadales bacterium]
HPNDHVNLGQSSNDVIPAAIQIGATLLAEVDLLPALRQLVAAIEERAAEFGAVAKTGRTHLMDAMPLTVGQELGCWAAQLRSAEQRLVDTLRRVRRLPIGGTAIGTGINADPAFAASVCAELTRISGSEFRSAPNLFEGIAA